MISLLCLPAHRSADPSGAAGGPRIFLTAFVLLGLCIAPPATGGGVVETCSEQHLRTALQGGGQVTFACDGVINLGESLTIERDTVIDASGRSVVLDGGNAVRHFAVNPGVTFTLRNLNLTRGSASYGGAILNNGETVLLEGVRFESNVGQYCGGAICSSGALVITNCVFEDNVAFGSGGAILISSGGWLLAEGSRFLNNKATGAHGREAEFPGSSGLPGGGALGGAIYCQNQVWMTRCAFSENRAIGGDGGSGANMLGGAGGNGGAGGMASGAALYAGGIVHLRDVSMVNNSAAGGHGGRGGIGSGHPLQHIPGPGGRGGDGGAAQGGAVAVLPGPCHLTNCTIAANLITGGNGGEGGSSTPCDGISPGGRGGNGGDGGTGGATHGAGAYLAGLDTRVTSSTLAENILIPGSGSPGGMAGQCPSGPYTNGIAGLSSPVSGSAIAIAPAATAVLINSILGVNYGAPNVTSNVLDGGFNLSADNTPTAADPGTRTNLEPSLAPLNLSETIAFFPLLPNSAAIDAGTCAGSAESDQRGVVRPTGPTCDIGAYEYDGTLKPLDIAVRFATDIVRTGRVVRVLVEIRNPNSSPAALGSLSVELPTPLVSVPGAPVLQGCGTGWFVPSPVTNRLLVTSMTLPPTNTCDVSFDVMARSPGLWTLANSSLFASGYGVRYAATRPSIRAVAGPTVTTGDGADATPATVSLTGWVNPNGAPTLAGFEWGTSSALGNFVAAQDLGDGFTPRPFSAALTGLEPNTVYYFRAVATNSESASQGEIRHTSTLGGVITDCTDATLRANLAAGQSVSFGCDGVIPLSNTLTLATNTVIDARGRTIVLSGQGAVRLFHVLPGVEATFQNVIFANGMSTNGGAMLNEGRLTLISCTFSNNLARGTAGENGTNGLKVSEDGTAGSPGGDARGGAVLNTGVFNATNCQFVANRALAGAGGMGGNGTNGLSEYDGRGRCVFGTRGGHAGYGGTGGQAAGGALFNQGTALVMNAAFALNEALGGAGGNSGAVGRGGCGAPGAISLNGPTGGVGQGGAIYNFGLLRLVASVLADNNATGGKGGAGSPYVGGYSWSGDGGNGGEALGGSIANVGTNELVNVTAIGNRASGGGGGPGGTQLGTCPTQYGNGGAAAGGAIDNLGFSALTNCTLWMNRSAGGVATNPCWPTLNGMAGGVFSSSIRAIGTGVTILANSIIGSEPSSVSNCFGVLFDAGHNLCSDFSAAYTGPGSLNGIDPHLGTLADHGGPTPTVPLLANSPAIDVGDDESCPLVDQRGVNRPYGWHCDIGAFEVVPDFFRLTSITRESTQIRVRGIGIPECTFSVEFTPDLLNWGAVALGTVSPEGRFEIFVERPDLTGFLRTRNR